MASSVGIALCAYNPNPDFLYRQLKSIQEQTFTDFTVRIQFDSPIQRVLEDSRFLWIENPSRKGFKKNFESNIGALAQTGVQWVALSDQDDIWHKEKLEKLVSAIHQSPPLSLVHSDLIPFWNDTDIHLDTPSVWTQEKRNVFSQPPEDILIRNIVTGCSALFDARLVEKYGVVSEAIDYHDHWYAVAAALEGGIYPVHEPLVYYRQHLSNVSGGVIPFQRRFPRLHHLKAAAHRQSQYLMSLEQVALDFIKINPTFHPQFSLLARKSKAPGLLLRSLRLWTQDPPLSQAAMRLGIGTLLSRS